MTRVLIAFGLMGVGMLVAFIAGFAFALWGVRQQNGDHRWN